MNDDLTVSVKDQIVGILGYGATPIASVEGLLQGAGKRAVRGVIASYPELFELFSRGYPENGEKVVWVRLRRVEDRS